MLVRRLIVVLIACFVCLALGRSLYLTLSPGGWTAAKAVMMFSCLCAAPWMGFCAANGLTGFVLRLPRALDPPDVNPSGPLPRTAIAVTIRDEDMTLVLPPLTRLLSGLDAAGHGDAFELFILSDSQGQTDTEERAIAAFGGGRVHYRRRMVNTGFKAGNIMTFLDQHGDAFELMLVLDADSQMTPQAVLRMICAMREDPRLGIIQHLTVGLPASSAFPRLFQFGMRAGMRIWATALDWWQGDECVYWGHNALIRTVPFRTQDRKSVV